MTNKFEIGDRVAVLDDAIEGVVVAIQNSQITIKTPDDFEMTFFVNELIKLQNSNELVNLFSSKSIGVVLHEKSASKKRNYTAEKRSKKDEFVLEVDLHIEKLIPTSKGMSNYEILNIQMDEVKRKVEFCIKNRL